MLKNPISELALFFDLEWVPDAASAKRLFDLPEATTEIEAMESLWKHSSKYDAKTNPRPFLKYMFSRVVSIAFLSRQHDLSRRGQGRRIQTELVSRTAVRRQRRPRN